MNRHLLSCLITISLSSFSLYGEAAKHSNSSEKRAGSAYEQNKPQDLVLFAPPQGWFSAPTDPHFPTVKFMVVGKAATTFPPSINLSTEPYPFTLKQYLKNIKNKNAAEGNEWKDLGSIKTEAGTASLSQVDTLTQWGKIRRMHVILLKNGRIYILTAAALVDEFSVYYKDFFDSMRSLKIINDPYEVISNPEDKKELQKTAGELQKQWAILLKQKKIENPALNDREVKQNLFIDQQFQDSLWKPFKQKIEKQYSMLGPEWLNLYLQIIEENLLEK